MGMEQGLSPERFAKYFDHTLLRADARQEDFQQFCCVADQYGFMAVMCNPAAVAICKGFLPGSEVRVGAGIAFPLGQTTLKTKLAEAREMVEQGVDEFDYLINITQLKAKNYAYIEKEMAEICAVGKKTGVTTKVIFENCYLSDEEKRTLCKIALDVRPDFIKTSTGYGPGGATYEDVKLMKGVVGDRVKIKAAGGIRTLEHALRFIELGAERIGSTASAEIVDAYKMGI